MIDSDRFITLDDLVESVPEVLVREAEEKMNSAQSAVEEVNYSIKDPFSMSKELSKAQRIRLYMENNPEARNRDVVEALQQFSVTAADVANVKSIAKRQGGNGSVVRSEPSAPSVGKKASLANTGMTNPGASITLPELEAGVAFVKTAGSIMRAKHLLIIIEQIKAC
ncbi:MAG: hypothetical protein LW724_11095 [Planctomycetaceae bacterium]|jgi:transglutaminase/protease-like cytokinesis protein 3|nr:hypothetical protein [Planctomycetaceae bacterium]